MLYIKYLAILYVILNTSFILTQELDSDILMSTNMLRNSKISYVCPKNRPKRCPEIYEPVCGYYDTTNIRCIFPCAENFSNPCVACSNPIVKTVMCGKCPRKPSNTHIITRYIKNSKWPKCYNRIDEEDDSSIN